MDAAIFDAHFHVIDPRFPLVANQGYLPAPFGVASYLEAARPLGVAGGAVVSGSFQASDQGDLLAAPQSGVLLRLRAIAGVTRIPQHTLPQENAAMYRRRSLRARALAALSATLLSTFVLYSFVAVPLAGFAPDAAAQAAKKEEFTPQVGQAGKDVIWVPTPEDLVERMLRMAQATSKDFVIDLGSGDGRIAIAAAKKAGARAMGIEYNPDMVELSNRKAREEGVAGQVKFVKADIFESDFSQATVITMYLLPGLNLKLRPKLLDMKPGTRLVSHQFNMDDWEPDERDNLEGRAAYLWIVPAKVQGTWKLNAGGETHDMTLTQRYQKVEGYVKLGRIEAGLRDVGLRGDEIKFAWVDNAGVRHQFSGRVSGASMEGAVRSEGGREGRWTASRR
jgi:hypothetical protein